MCVCVCLLPARAGPDGPDPKLLAMSQLHMLGEVLAALFERLHARDSEGAEREEALCAALRDAGIAIPAVALAAERHAERALAPAAIYGAATPAESEI